VPRINARKSKKVSGVNDVNSITAGFDQNKEEEMPTTNTG
jgi:hypothetical protein